MKVIFPIFILILLVNNYKNGNSQETPKRNDTLFIIKDQKLGTKQSIYFENNKNSKFYEELKDYEFDDFDQQTYNESLKNINQKLNKQKPVFSETKWLPLYSYKNKYYVYNPCDFYTEYKVSINDSTLIDWTGDGPIANLILSQKKLRDNHYEFNLKSYQSRKLTIKIIDKRRGIALFKNEYKNEIPEYLLMVATNKINEFPLIINNCETYKQNELKFDEIDIKKLTNDYR